MKKFIFILMAFCVTMVAAKAQTALVSAAGNQLDTVINTATKYLILSSPYNGYFKTVEVAATLTKISGTVGGTVTLEYSVDGTNYYGYKKDSIYTPTDVSTQTFGWSIKDWGARFLRVKMVGTGTEAVQIKAKSYGRKENI